MNRPVLTLIVGAMAVAGCARGRSSIRDINRGAELPPASVSELPPIETSAENGADSNDPTRPATKNWSRAGTETTRGQSPDSPEDKAPATAPEPTEDPPSSTSRTVPQYELPAPDQMRSSELKSQISPGQLLGITMASVGGEAITSNEVQSEFNEFVRQNVPAGQRIPRADAELLIHRTLEQIIDRTVIVQEAKRSFLKSANQQKMFNEFCEKQWNEHELPPLFRKNKVTNEFELRKKLTEKGDSLDERKQRYEREFLAREFLNMRLQSRMRPTLPEMRSYYEAHREDFHRKAKVTWREIVVKGHDARSREKIDALLVRLRRGDSFETVAKTSSEGPTAQKGGKWETSLGATAAPAVNSALETLAMKQISTILEGPTGYHIIRVDDRQAEGPAPFSTVQDQIYTTLLNQNFQREMDAYVKKLRSKTLITYWINGNAPAPAGGARPPEPSGDPEAIRTSAKHP